MTEDSVISQEDVRHVARLARLHLEEDEVKSMAQDLGSILGYVQKLDELDTEDVPATFHAVELGTRLRPDEVSEGLPVDLGLKGAPERIGDGFGVPKIID